MRIVALVVLLLLSGCQSTPTATFALNVRTNATDGQQRNQLIRQLRQHGYMISSQANFVVALLEEDFSQQSALSGSDNLSHNRWLRLRVKYQLRYNHHREIRTLEERRLLRDNTIFTLAAEHEAATLKRNMQTALAERIVYHISRVNWIQS